MHGSIVMAHPAVQIVELGSLYLGLIPATIDIRIEQLNLEDCGWLYHASTGTMLSCTMWLTVVGRAMPRQGSSSTTPNRGPLAQQWPLGIMSSSLYTHAFQQYFTS